MIIVHQIVIILLTVWTSSHAVLSGSQTDSFETFSILARLAVTSLLTCLSILLTSTVVIFSFWSFTLHSYKMVLYMSSYIYHHLPCHCNHFYQHAPRVLSSPYLHILQVHNHLRILHHIHLNLHHNLHNRLQHNLHIQHNLSLLLVPHLSSSVYFHNLQI